MGLPGNKQDIASNVNGCALHTYVGIFRAPGETNNKLLLTCHFGEAVSDGVDEYSGMSVFSATVFRDVAHLSGGRYENRRPPQEAENNNKCVVFC